jgi:hypothetical protein
VPAMSAIVSTAPVTKRSESPSWTLLQGSSLGTISQPTSVPAVITSRLCGRGPERAGGITPISSVVQERFRVNTLLDELPQKTAAVQGFRCWPRALAIRTAPAPTIGVVPVDALAAIDARCATATPRTGALEGVGVSPRADTAFDSAGRREVNLPTIKDCAPFYEARPHRRGVIVPLTDRATWTAQRRMASPLQPHGPPATSFLLP